MIQRPGGDADRGRNVTICRDFVPMHREHFSGNDQNPLSGLNRTGIRWSTESFHDWFRFLRRRHVASITHSYDKTTTEVSWFEFTSHSSLTDRWVNYAHIMSAAQNSTQTSIPPLDEFIETARKWLEAHTEYRSGGSDDKDLVWGEGEFSVSVFHSLTFEEETALLEKAKAWTQAKAEHGYHAITQPVEYGGLGYPREYARAYSKLESLFVTPTGHETHSVTVGLIAPTINVYGTPEQKEQFVGRFMATR